MRRSGAIFLRTGKFTAFAIPLMLLTWAGVAIADGWDPPGAPGGGSPYTRASNTDSIVNTRHNMTMSYIPGGWGNWMDYARNNYGEVCVYCHTPHGANSQLDAPRCGTGRTLGTRTRCTTYR